MKCFLPAWIAAWVIAVFLPSALIAYLGLSPAAAAIGTGFERLPAASWKVADDVGPVVKLMIGGFLLIGFLGLDRVAPASRITRYPGAIGIGIAAIVFTLSCVPEALSRGFAAKLTGSRFDSTTLPLYLLGGALAGFAYLFTAERCRRRG